MTAAARSLALPTGLPRSHGRAEIARADGRLTRLYQSGCAKILVPRGGKEAVMVNTAGGLTGGDTLEFGVSLGAQEHLTLTTQAAERLYRSVGDTAARVRNRVSLDAGARLDWLPQETILFDESALDRQLDADLSGDARLLAIEPVIFGRPAHGEILAHLHLRDRWRIRRNGALIHAEALRLDGLPRSNATLGAIGACATLVLAAPHAADHLDAARAALEGTESGASAPDNDLLVARILAPSGQALRAALLPLLATLRDGPPPRVWQL